MPELDKQLLAKGSREHFGRQSRQASHLDASQLSGWQAVWTAMKEQQVSIKQQHMLALAARLRIVPRHPQ
ncbi:hypothetical protein D3C78_1904690 [compost metagenome]